MMFALFIGTFRVSQKMHTTQNVSSPKAAEFSFLDIIAHKGPTGTITVEDYQLFFRGDCYSRLALRNYDRYVSDQADLHALGEALVVDRRGLDLRTLSEPVTYNLSEADVDEMYLKQEAAS
jgi:hypothetical protein